MFFPNVSIWEELLIKYFMKDWPVHIFSFFCLMLRKNHLISTGIGRVKKAISLLMLCAPVFIFTSGTSSLLGHPRCGVSIWLSLLAIFDKLFWVYADLFHEKTNKTREYSKSAIFIWYENGCRRLLGAQSINSKRASSRVSKTEKTACQYWNLSNSHGTQITGSPAELSDMWPKFSQVWLPLSSKVMMSQKQFFWNYGFYSIVRNNLSEKSSHAKKWLFSALNSWDMGFWSSNCFILNSLI